MKFLKTNILLVIVSIKVTIAFAATTCPYGDLLSVTSNDIGNAITLPSPNMNCTSVFNLLSSLNYDPIWFCKYQSITFGTTCCQTCSSNGIIFHWFSKY